MLHNDNWQRQAVEHNSTITKLREELWSRVGLRLGLLERSRLKTEKTHQQL